MPRPSAPALPLKDEEKAGPLPQSRIFAALLSDLRASARRLTRSAQDADDLVQDTLLRVWSRMAMAAEAASDAAPIEDLRAYAFATLRHRAFARFSIAPPLEAEDEDFPAPRGSDAATRLGCAEALAALDDLPADQQRLLRMRAMDGLSYAEIAKKTGLPLGTVTSRLARGRAAMREALDLPPGAPVTDLLGGS
ncbi:RNA polymerase sigma factor [Hasllibacter sp. MH4015]|uniref:RNA polymerase sigma factor n=1 Tax=Hasllibacter sp. MH4015 TaxID=2854029 RepID=UPI001CD53115|nr:RNA polymerase sigma factor [Hasllibacter sp. MH4015]